MENGKAVVRVFALCDKVNVVTCSRFNSALLFWNGFEIGKARESYMLSMSFYVATKTCDLCVCECIWIRLTRRKSLSAEE